ncbi:MAG: 3-deoxy-manno-octulosonate cytidylyltransferase [Candidatus Methylomirabilis oxygeniifera]|uniref:3-deoxy-manno-octulosonate cytidylyltransferase n=1 Tax=Methylomirabilis oxygeniifera TaxID=671143 RepID=D5MMH6_METO1|nr:MAG: 3-deoxy-manno-octulosonate cytidylyltransferase [Candidatus Methylomirabilis oxyfera]CBE70098.1 CTP:CMP-3-deoxy-D-manno-octulosonate transferase [Candidatus Methylomirabilis oxyfera]
MQHHAKRTIVGVIPARLASTRLPGKVLRPICGRPMLYHVFARASRCGLLDDLVVATDSKEVYDYCVGNRMKVRMTSSCHASGTDRIHEVMQTLSADIYVNIQGDEPMIRPAHLEVLLQSFLKDPSVQVGTVKTLITAEEAHNPNCVKVVTDLDGRALYFSRHAIPYNRDRIAEIGYFKHLGIYAYTGPALQRFHQLLPSLLEQTEKLEQLRFLEHGIPISVVETPYDTIGVDTEEDLARVERYFQERESLESA